MPIAHDNLLDIVKVLDFRNDLVFLTCLYLMAKKSSIIPPSTTNTNKEY